MKLMTKIHCTQSIRVHTEIWCGNLREGNHLEDPSIDGRNLVNIVPLYMYSVDKLRISAIHYNTFIVFNAAETCSNVKYNKGVMLDGR